MSIPRDPKASRSLGFLLLPLLFAIFALSLTLWIPAGVAQDAGGESYANPLAPPDTSSPRDTLRSFLGNANIAVEDRQRGSLSPRGHQAYRRAANTLDFSATSEGDSTFVQTLRTILLHEVLARVELPPDDQIPGPKQVADPAITHWVIPGTSMKIERIEQGPRSGEFLFSAETVAKIDRLYRRSKHLPYRPGATPGIYELIVRAEDTQFARMSKLRNRLKPVDTSNPRATLDGFLESINRAHTLIMEADAALQSTPPTMTREEAVEAEDMARHLIERSTVALDLSQVPEALREDAGVETALQLKEVLDRLLLPPVDTVPNAQMVAAARQGALGSFVRGSGPLRWRVPNTEIEIAEITEGERQGEFLFRARTVERIPGDYEEVRDLPYREQSFGGLELDYLSPGLSEGFYEYYVSNPGNLVPRANALGTLVDRFPAWLKRLYGDQTLWQWIGLLLSVLAAILAAALSTRVIRRLTRRLGSPLDDWVRILSPIVVAVLISAVGRFIDADLNITGNALAAVSLLAEGIILTMVAWAVFVLCKAVAETVIASPRTSIKEESIDATMWRIGANIAGFLLGAWILIEGMQRLGANVLPLLAGLGVGGLAVALAARETLTDVFGSLIILADRPYRIGHWVIIGDKEGTVESIGIRSTRIRTFYDSVLSIPNSEAVSKIIDNMGMRTYRRVYTKVGIRYDTPPERVEAFLEGIKRIIQTNPTTRKDYFHVVLKDFGPDSLVVMLYFFVKVPDWASELVERQRVFLEVLRLADALGVQFAFPTQTLEIETFPGRPQREAQPAASDEELRGITERFASTAGAARPRGLGIFVPPHEENLRRP